MTDTSQAAPALDALRRELDALDEAMLNLLAKRSNITQQVRSFKQVTAKTVMSPLRPAREAQIHRRIIDMAKPHGIDPVFALSLWRNILTNSSLSQAPIKLHVSKRLSSKRDQRLCLHEHFPAMPVEEWNDEAEALSQLNLNLGDICVVETESPWIEPCVAGQAGSAQVIGALPVIKGDTAPQLLIFGNAPTEPSGQDETLIITEGNLPRDFNLLPLWQVKTGPWYLSALAGFHAEHEGPLVGLARSNISLGLKLAGRYPSGLEV